MFSGGKKQEVLTWCLNDITRFLKQYFKILKQDLIGLRHNLRQS